MKKLHIPKKLHPSLKNIIATSVIIAVIFVTHLIILPMLDTAAKKYLTSPNDILVISNEYPYTLAKYYNYDTIKILDDMVSLSCDNIGEISEVQTKEYMTRLNFTGSRVNRYVSFNRLYESNIKIEYVKKLGDSLYALVLKGENTDGQSVYYALFFAEKGNNVIDSLVNNPDYTGIMLCVNPTLVSKEEVRNGFWGNVNQTEIYVDKYPEVFKCEYPFTTLKSKADDWYLKDIMESEKYEYGYEYHLLSDGIAEFTVDKEFQKKSIKYLEDSQLALFLEAPEQNEVNEFINELREFVNGKSATPH